MEPDCSFQARILSALFYMRLIMPSFCLIGHRLNSCCLRSIQNNGVAQLDAVQPP